MLRHSHTKQSKTQPQPRSAVAHPAPSVAVTQSPLNMGECHWTQVNQSRAAEASLTAGFTSVHQFCSMIFNHVQIFSDCIKSVLLTFTQVFSLLHTFCLYV